MSQSPNRGPLLPTLGGSKIVSIRVGKAEDRQTFYVSKDFLCHHSPFFAAAFNGSFMEGATQVMDFESTTPAIFSVLVDFIYTQTLEHVPSNRLLPSTAVLIGLGVLAESIIMPDLQRKVVAKIRGKIAAKEALDLESFDWEWFTENSRSEMLIRRLLVDYFAFDVLPEDFDLLTKGLSKEMLADVAVATRKYLRFLKDQGVFDSSEIEALRTRALATKSDIYSDGNTQWYHAQSFRSLRPGLSPNARKLFDADLKRKLFDADVNLNTGTLRTNLVGVASNLGMSASEVSAAVEELWGVTEPEHGRYVGAAALFELFCDDSA